MNKTDFVKWWDDKCWCLDWMLIDFENDKKMGNFVDTVLNEFSLNKC